MIWVHLSIGQSVWVFFEKLQGKLICHKFSASTNFFTKTLLKKLIFKLLKILKQLVTIDQLFKDKNSVDTYSSGVIAKSMSLSSSLVHKIFHLFQFFLLLMPMMVGSHENRLIFS